jgi:MFS family permease
MKPLPADPSEAGASLARRASPYAWLVLALTFGLLLSDYMSRQLLAAVFPLLKAEWRLSDSQLGALGGVVPLAVGALTLPLSFLADRIGRVRSITAMAVAWSLATIACGLSRHYGELLLARLVVGIGEAAYGSVGIALIVSVFPRSMRAAVCGAFTAGGLFGSVLGLASGGLIAEHLGWRWAFAIVGLAGLALACVYPLLVREQRARAAAEVASGSAGAERRLQGNWLKRLGLAIFPSWTTVWTYFGSGAQLFIAAALMAWVPSFLNRYYGMAPGAAAMTSSVFVLAGGLGMIGCGALADRISRGEQKLQLKVAASYCLATAALLGLAMQLPAGGAQLVLLAAAMTLASGVFGPASAAVAAGAPAEAHGTAFAALTLANNFLGLAPGPFVTGAAADRWGLLHALQLAPLAGVIAAGAFVLALRSAARRGPYRAAAGLETVESR